MDFTPISAISSLIQTGLNKFLPDKMSEEDRAKLSNEMNQFMLEEASKEEGDFRNFILSYEGSADKLPNGLVWFRSLVRPLFTYLVGYLDFLYFQHGVTWDPSQSSLLGTINIIILVFWFGERAVVNSGFIDVVKSFFINRKPT